MTLRPEDISGKDREALQQRIRELEERLASQAREIRALEKIEALQERAQGLEQESQRLRERVAELHTFLSVSRGLAATLEPEELLRLALHLLARAVPGEAFALFLREEPGERLSLKAALGGPEEGARPAPLGAGEGLAGLVARTGQALLVPDLAAEPRVAPAELLRPPPGALLCLPLQRPGGPLRGVLTIQRPEPHGFRLPELDLGQAVAHQVATALETAQLFQRARELATRDELTGLFNRRHFLEALDQEVQRARRYRRAFALLLLDLDAFKAYNDAHGHLQGDAALQGLARLLLRSTRRADVVARFGGEEFVILLPEVTGPGAAVVAEKIRAAVAAHPFPGRERQPAGALTLTIGLASYPAEAEEGLALLELADRALYLGKRQGGNCVCTPPTPPPPA